MSQYAVRIAHIMTTTVRICRAQTVWNLKIGRGIKKMINFIIGLIIGAPIGFAISAIVSANGRD